MATTALFAELLVIGLLADVWLGLAVIGVTQASIGAIASFLRGWEALVTVGVLAQAYVLGLLVDRIVDTATEWIDKWLLRPSKAGRTRLWVLSAPTPVVDSCSTSEVGDALRAPLH